MKENIDKELLKVLCCPKCNGTLTLKKDLKCKKCNSTYKVKDNVPIMLKN